MSSGLSAAASVWMEIQPTNHRSRLAGLTAVPEVRLFIQQTYSRSVVAVLPTSTRVWERVRQATRNDIAGIPGTSGVWAFVQPINHWNFVAGVPSPTEIRPQFQPFDGRYCLARPSTTTCNWQATNTSGALGVWDLHQAMSARQLVHEMLRNFPLLVPV